LNAYSIQETLQPGHKGWIIRSLDITTRNETSFESRFKATDQSSSLRLAHPVFPIDRDFSDGGEGGERS